MSAALSERYITSPMSIVVLAAFGLLGNIAAIILPIVVGSLMDSGLSTVQVGYAEAADMGGIAIGALLWSRLMLRVNWRFAALCAIPVAVAGNIICALMPTFGPVVGGRLLSGLGSGLLAAIGSAGLALTVRPERSFGLASTANMVAAAGFVYSFTFISHRAGGAAVFFSIAAIFAGMALVLKWLPVQPPEARLLGTTAVVDSLSNASKIPWRMAGLALAGIWAYFMAAMVFWTYVERIGVAANFSTAFIARSLGIGQLMGACGALTTAVLASYFHRRLAPVAVYIALAACAAMLFTTQPHPWPFFAAICMLFFSWSGAYPYFIGTVVAIDPTARLVALTITISFIGKSMAPPVAAYLARGTDYTHAYYFSTIGFLVSLALLLAPLLRAEKLVGTRNSPAAAGATQELKLRG